MRTHDELVKAMLCKPGVKSEVERIEREESEVLYAMPAQELQAGLAPSNVRVEFSLPFAMGDNALSKRMSTK